MTVHIGTASDPEHFYSELFIVNAVDHPVVPDMSTMEADLTFIRLAFIGPGDLRADAVFTSHAIASCRAEARNTSLRRAGEAA